MSIKKYTSVNLLREEMLLLHDPTHKVVTTNGCFDLLHPGHIRSFEKAKKYGDVLIVLINSDSSVERLKGPGRPINLLIDRVEMVASLEIVDFVLVFQEDDPRLCLEAMYRKGVKVDFHVKPGYKMEDIIELDVIQDIHHGTVVLTDLIPDQSTSRIIARVIESNRVQSRLLIPGGDEL